MCWCVCRSHQPNREVISPLEAQREPISSSSTSFCLLSRSQSQKSYKQISVSAFSGTLVSMLGFSVEHHWFKSLFCISVSPGSRQKSDKQGVFVAFDGTVVSVTIFGV